MTVHPIGCRKLLWRNHRATKTLRLLDSFCKYYHLCFTPLRHCQPTPSSQHCTPTPLLCTTRVGNSSGSKSQISHHPQPLETHRKAVWGQIRLLLKGGAGSKKGKVLGKESTGPGVQAGGTWMSPTLLRERTWSRNSRPALLLSHR